MKLFGGEISNDTLVVIFGIYGVDLPPRVRPSGVELEFMEPSKKRFSLGINHHLAGARRGENSKPQLVSTPTGKAAKTGGGGE